MSLPTFRVHYEHLSVSGPAPKTADVVASSAEAARKSILERSKARAERIRINKIKLVRETADV
ncbi:hypothetical protein JP74_09070 [Devosia sp. 17-2-E-8]|nr:hypothetical protein JP74_09070 [Devosia sp. 17-2-E-8]